MSTRIYGKNCTCIYIYINHTNICTFDNVVRNNADEVRIKCVTAICVCHVVHTICAYRTRYDACDPND